MAQIILGYRQDKNKWGTSPIMTYSNSFHKALVELGHKVLPIGQGHQCNDLDSLPKVAYEQSALFIDLDSGRNTKGDLSFHCFEKKARIPSAVRYIDSHGQPSYHKRAAANYDHVFFAVWNRRDLFVKHPSAHWCPNASDDEYFDGAVHLAENGTKTSIAGFFGSKGGLDRADVLQSVCERNKWTFDIREIGKSGNRWPATALAMSDCKVLFNVGQKHDGPNQRVIESMLLNRPLLNNRDELDGMNKLFVEGEHYLGFSMIPELVESDIANQIMWCLKESDLAKTMAERAYAEVKQKHLVKHRVQQILEVCGIE